MRLTWQLACFSASILLCLAFVLFLDGEVLLSLYKRFSFYILFLTFVYWIWLLCTAVQSSTSPGQSRFSWQVGIPLSGVLILGIFLVSPYQFRVLSDETNLLGVAFSMFSQQSVSNITQKLEIMGNLYIIEEQWDIRPNFFPFLVYVVHSLTGYSGYNGFVVNAVAGFGALYCFFLLLHRWFGQAIAILGVMILAAFPIFTLWVTSSSFEILNLFMALLSFQLLAKVVRDQCPVVLECLLVTLVLLAQSRYESIIFFMVFLFCLGLMAYQGKLPSLPHRLVVLPWLLLPVAWQRLGSFSRADYDLYDPDVKLFSIENWVNNFFSGYEFFAGYESWFGTIPVVFYGAMIGVVVLLFRMFKSTSIGEQDRIVLLAVVFSFYSLIAVVFSYYVGDITQAFTIRLGIIFIPYVIASFCFLVWWLNKSPFIPQLTSRFAIILGLSFCISHWPVAAQNQAAQQLIYTRYYNLVLAELQEKFPHQNTVIVADRPGMFTVHQWSALSIKQANASNQAIVEEHHKGLYRDVVFVQLIKYADGAATERTRVSDLFELEIVFEEQLDQYTKIRISKLV